MTIARAICVVAICLLCACERRPARIEGETTLFVRERKPIFRTVHLEGVDVVLGQRLLDKAKVGEPVGDTAVRVPNARFAGAKAIQISLGPGDTVRGMTYDYGVDTAFDVRIQDYVQLLGPPTRRSARGTAGVDLTDIVEWEDSATHFELRWITTGQGAVAHSVLRDRQSGSHAAPLSNDR
jgi:hypothetical protein